MGLIKCKNDFNFSEVKIILENKNIYKTGYFFPAAAAAFSSSRA